MTKLQLSESEIYELANSMLLDVWPEADILQNQPQYVQLNWIHEALEAIEYYNTVNEFLHESGLNNSNDIKKVIS